MKTFALIVFGCQMNVYDADCLRSELISRGWTETSQEEAELLLFVTCSIRDKAEQKVWSVLGRFKKSWEEKGTPRVGVVGCMAQRLGKAFIKRFPWIFLVVGPRHLGTVVPAVESHFSTGETFIHLDENPRDLVDMPRSSLHRSNPWKAFVSIAHGCDNFCTYCIVPHVRGRFQSRDPREILREIRELVSRGVVEVTLLGQNVNSYGTDRNDGWSFAKLLRECASVWGLKRLRFATNHPKDMAEDVVQVMAEGAPVICPSLNLPIQSGSDRVLTMMNRGYSLDYYASVVELLRQRIPHVAITSDLIVGFPGETPEDFEDSCKALERFQFDQVHTAAYSPRPGTRAAAMAGQIPREELFRRLDRVNQIQRHIALQKNKAFEGTVQEVLMDGIPPRGEGIQGRSPADKVVVVPGGESLLGAISPVRILSADHWSLRGEILEERNSL